MIKKFRSVVFPLSIFLVFVVYSCSNPAKLKKQIAQLFESTPGVYALAYKNLTTGEELLINETIEFHAASTMKTPVMLEVFKQMEEGKWSLDSKVPLKNSFKSIVDGSVYTLSPEDDSEQELYSQLGTYQTLGELVYEMIIVSSNLATNMVIELVGAKNVTSTMRMIGANDIQVLRGVEDLKAFDQGLNNTTTAKDLMILFEEIASPTIISEESAGNMIKILSDQKFNEVIPGKLPPELQIAHKTGRITGVQHDSGIVFLPDGRKYVLVLLSKDIEDRNEAIEMMATVSELIYLSLQ